MADVEVSLHLPYRLVLPAGDYPTPAVGGAVSISDAVRSDPMMADTGGTTRASSTFAADPTVGWDDIIEHQIREADRLLRRVNHLLRWYRVAAVQPVVLEVTRAQVGRFTFKPDGHATTSVWVDAADLVYEDPRPSATSPVPSDAVAEAIRSGLAGKTEPDVAALNLLDAQYAVSVGRFREAVLLCWSVIDSTFVRAFDRLVDERLPAEWPDGRRFLKGFDFGLRQKMTSGLRLVAGRSLYEEPDGLWDRLSASYGLRNAIIHAGQLAAEDQAAQAVAVAVAKRMVAIAADLQSQVTPSPAASAVP